MPEAAPSSANAEPPSVAAKSDACSLFCVRRPPLARSFLFIGYFLSMVTGGVSNSKSRSRRLTYQRVVVVGFAGKVPVKMEGVRWRFDFESNEDDASRMFRRV